MKVFLKSVTFIPVFQFYLSLSLEFCYAIYSSPNVYYINKNIKCNIPPQKKLWILIFKIQPSKQQSSFSKLVT